MFKYRKIIFTIFILICCAFSMSGASIDIVYPKKNGAMINAKSTFFVGSANPKKKLYINSQEVEVAPNGGFAHFVKLDKEGINDFVIKSGDEEIKFTVVKTSNTVPAKSSPLVEHSLKEYRVLKTTPLRTTPVDGGINRLCELPEQTKLLINGEKGNFLRVYLCKDKFGWVAKRDVEYADTQNTDLTEIKKIRQRNHKNFTQFDIYLTEKIPLSITENENELIFTLFNTNEDCCIIKHKYKKLAGYSYEYKPDKLILKIRNEKALQNKPLIAIDAGHGGKELGAIGCCRIPEKEINLKIAKYLHDELSNRGVNSILTRNSDTTMPLSKRCELAKEHDATLLVSIHSNALPDGKNPLNHRGTSVYYYHPQAKSLAQSVLNEIVTQVNTNNDNIRQASLALTRPASSVSILIEVAYMINPYDYTMLTDEDFQKNCAKAIADGIVKYLQAP